MEDSGDDLYVMQYVFKGVIDDTVVKIGKSANPEARRKALESSQNFRVRLCAVFRGWGKHEHAVHQHLANQQSTDGAGKEWFHMSLLEAVKVISETVMEEASEERRTKRPRIELEAEEELSGKAVVSEPSRVDIPELEMDGEDSALDDDAGIIEEEDVHPNGVLSSRDLWRLQRELQECRSRNGVPLVQSVYLEKIEKLVKHYRVTNTHPKGRVRERLPALKAIFDREFGKMPGEDLSPFMADGS
jgi:hypothetical protein